MSTPRLVELAKEGHPEAIARLINQQLKSRGVTAVASRQGDCLRLLLEAPKQPNEAFLVPYLCKALTKLGSPMIQQVALYGRRQGEAQGWQTKLMLLERQYVLDANGCLDSQAPEHSQYDDSHHGGSRLLSHSAEAQRRRAERAKFVAPALDFASEVEGMDSLEQALIHHPKSAPKKPQRRHEARHEPQLPRLRKSRSAFNPLQSNRRSPRIDKRPGSAQTSLYRPSARPWRRDSSSGTPSTTAQPEKISPQQKQTGSVAVKERKERKERSTSLNGAASHWPFAQPKLHSDPSLETAQKRQPWLLVEWVRLWLGWQWAAWSTTLLLAMAAVPVVTLALFSVFSLLNRFEEQFMVAFSLGCLAFIPLLGLLLGDAQTRLLRKRLHNIGGWRWMTMLGVVLGFAIAVGSHFAIATIFAPVVSEPNPDFVIGRGLPFVASTLGVGLGCLILGFLQWLMITTSIAKSYLWPLATSLGSIMSWIAGMLMSATWIGPRFFPDAAEPSNFWSSLFLWMAGGLVSWLLFHALSGTVMAALLRDSPRLDQPESEEAIAS